MFFIAGGAPNDESDELKAIKVWCEETRRPWAEVAEWAHAPHEDNAGGADLAPFDDVEGELFVRLAETEGGATAAAAAAATEWEKAASRAAATSSFSPSSSTSSSSSSISAGAASASASDNARGGGGSFSSATTDASAATTSTATASATATAAASSTGASNIVSAAFATTPPAAVSTSASTAASHQNHRAGPTIFERLWQLRRETSEERMHQLESHRMKRYVDAVQSAMDAGPVQTSLSAVYTGERHSEDDVGLDMMEEEDYFEGGRSGTVSGGGLASWLVWSR